MGATALRYRIIRKRKFLHEMRRMLKQIKGMKKVEVQVAKKRSAWPENKNRWKSVYLAGRMKMAEIPEISRILADSYAEI